MPQPYEGKAEEDICNLGHHTTLSELKCLSTRRKVHIRGALECAICFWSKHLLKISGSSSHIEEVQKAVAEFFVTLDQSPRIHGESW